ncbi:MAG: hypothetical protein M3R61_03190 [Chloroflexota bacterium]|nr:hypothetical protein [Chloroflexota bacterium]
MATQLNRSPEPINSALGMPAGSTPSRWRYLWPALLVAGPLILLILIWNRALDQTIIHDPLIHVLITLVASLLGVILALLVLHMARRAQDGRIFLIGMGFLGATGIFITHSISTPNVLMSGRGSATGISALFSLVLGSFFFALSGLNISPQLNRWLMRHARLWLMIFLAFWLTYNWILLVTVHTISMARESPPAEHEHAASAQAEEYAPSAEAHEEYQADAATSGSPLDLLRGVLVFVGVGCYIFAVGRHYHSRNSAASTTRNRRFRAAPALG